MAKPPLNFWPPNNVWTAIEGVRAKPELCQDYGMGIAHFFGKRFFASVRGNKVGVQDSRILQDSSGIPPGFQPGLKNIYFGKALLQEKFKNENGFRNRQSNDIAVLPVLDDS